MSESERIVTMDLNRNTMSCICTSISTVEGVTMTETEPATGGEMNTTATVLGVLFALILIIVISALAAVYVLWKDGCCKRRQDESNEGKR